MKFLKDHIAPTLHNAIGGVITFVLLAIGGLLIAFIKPFRDEAVAFALRQVPAYVVLLVTVAAILGWFLLLRTKRRLRSVKQELKDVQNHPHRFRDDCIFDPKLGLYRHKTKPELFCGTCTPKDIESPLRVQENGWMCLIDNKHWHPNPDYEAPTSQAIYRADLI